ERAEIETRAALSVSEHIRDQPGVDFAKTGLVQSNVVVRGFNNIFSGAMLVLTDNRIARVPSLRLNAYNFIPSNGADIERIEVVLGPGAALYGPNSANGVMHLITRSPFTSGGTTVQLGLGERSLRKGLVRHAATLTPKLAVKLSAQYYTGEDWIGYDRQESAYAAAHPERGRQVTGYEVITGRDTTLHTIRDFDLERQSLEARLDYRPFDEMTAVLSYGYSKGNNIELTGLGAGQAKDWAYNYLQTRFIYQDWFAQYYHNWSDAGDTFLFQTGQPVVDKSTLDVFQIQHSAFLGTRHKFTYGADALFTRPDTKGTITGQNEDDDDINEFGAYLQSETELTSNLDLVLALRYDDHNRLDDAEISPRAALLFKPKESQTLRVTYNRAFSTPSTNNLYLDLLTGPDPFGLGAFESSLGFSPAVDVRAQGTYRGGFDDGFTFRRADDGAPMYRSSFSPVLQGQLAAIGLAPGSPGYSLDGDGFIALHDPIATNVQWNIGAAATLQQFGPALGQLAPGLIAQQLIAAGLDAVTAQAQGEATAAAVVAALPSLIPSQLPGLRNTMAELNLQTFAFDPVADAIDVPRAKSTITQTIELGYKGIIGGNVVVAADLYRSEIEDFGGPLQVETPNVFLDPASLVQALGPAMQAVLDDPDNAQVASVLAALDQTSIPGVVTGNNNGTAADELTAIFAGGAARIPYGTVSPEQAYDPTAVLLTYRNFGDVTLYGVDLSLGYYPTDDWTLTGSYSFVSDDYWPNLSNVDDVALNAPQHKFKVGTSYDIPDLGLRTGVSVRHNGSFPMNSGVYVGDVDAYTVLDLQARYELPFEGLNLLLNVDNALDSGYRAFVGAPEVGRLIYA
ncbi:MAG: TonB-dependent receptor, partial [Gemmatimonadetes bacterium]|nr:TonB-dependent receptor [Gemmatimonadota bacterium]